MTSVGELRVGELSVGVELVGFVLVNSPCALLVSIGVLVLEGGAGGGVLVAADS